MIKLFDSYTNQEKLLVINQNTVSLYVCGPTVYNHIHVGNARPLVIFDILRRFLEFNKIKVVHVSNYTDIDDKIIFKAIKQETTPQKIAQKYIQEYQKVTKSLNILIPHHSPLVTNHISYVIKLITKLLDKGCAYISPHSKDVYFDVDKSVNYGKLANQNLEKLMTSCNDLKNQEGLNFVLWKKTNNEPSFPSPWGLGRPGWHSECLAIIDKYFPSLPIDIHGGGIDLKFPHHTNEIAQASCLQKQNLAQIWMHNGFVNIKKQKMAKSLDNSLLLKDQLNKWGMIAVKLTLLNAHYQKPINYSQQVLEQNSILAHKIIKALNQIKAKNQAHTGNYVEQVIASLSNNLNTPNAITTLLQAIKDFNHQKHCGLVIKNKVEEQILTITYLLGLR